jgi:hypothetical protein
MKHYNCNLTLQNLGSNLLLILRSPNPRDIEESFFSLYNLEATGGSLTFALNNTGICWSNKAGLARYFRNLFAHTHLHKYKKIMKGLDSEANTFVNDKVTELMENSEVFMDFSKKDNELSEFSNGVIKSEKPDENYRDMAITSGLESKSVVE